MNTYTVSFFGHKELENPIEIENRLEKIIHDLIMQKEYIEFLIGRDGEFDLLASSVIKRVTASHDYGNTSFVLVLPYPKAEYINNEQSYLNYYDEVEICGESSNCHFKAAIQLRNKTMVDRSDLVVCCIRHKSGGAYKTIRYAEKQNCEIINVAENIQK